MYHMTPGTGRPRRSRSRSRPGGASQVVGWSNNNFNNLHFKLSLETNKQLYMFQTHNDYCLWIVET